MAQGDERTFEAVDYQDPSEVLMLNEEGETPEPKSLYGKRCWKIFEFLTSDKKRCEVIKMRFLYQKLSINQISEITGLTRRTVRIYLKDFNEIRRSAR